MSVFNNTAPTEFTDYRAEELRGEVRGLMNELGIPAHLKGFGYLSRAIEIVYLDPSAIRGTVKGLYRRIALENGTTAACVERDNRTALKSAWSTRSGDMRDEYFSDASAPTSREFIATLADRLRRNLTHVELCTHACVGGDV